jgi:4'-phosphopantetheinyl transferase
MDQPTTAQSSGSRVHHRAAGAQCEVYVGRIADLRAAHLSLLDVGEVERGRQYRLAADSNRCLLGAVLLRVAAARHLGVRPADVNVDRACGRCGAQHGRPQLPGSGLNASVSHSGDIVAVAITSAGPVGVDIESVRAIDFTTVATSVCTPAELTDLRVAADFYAFWTRKEAVLKATGEGLARPMTDLRVTPPGSAPALLGLGDGAPPDCRMQDISVGDGYQACVAVLTAHPVAVTVLDARQMLASSAP